MPKQKKVKAIKQEKRFHLLLSVGELIYDGYGDTVLEAIEAVRMKANKFLIKTWGIFTLTDGKKKAELELRPFQIRGMLFGGSFGKDMFSKKLTMLLK